MDADWAIQQLASTAVAIPQLAQLIVEPHAHIRPTPESWSIVEVINHLVDEEREDFRQRLDLLLHNPTAPWPPIDPVGWVTERAYQQRSLAPSVAAFTAERQRSLQWLQSLAAPDWNQGQQHPAGFFMRAGDLLAAWAAHDLLHLRQLVELQYHIVQLQAAPYVVDYAGDW